MTISMTELPADQRPRERLVALGPSALTDVELLALVIRHGLRGRNVLDLARELLTEHGGVAGLAAARPEELADSAGIGMAKASAIVAAFHLGSRERAVRNRVVRLDSEVDIACAARELFVGARTERALVLVCDTQDQLRRSVFIADGAVDEVMVSVREVLNTVLRHDGRSFAVVHNHPSGDPRPSNDDRYITAQLAAAADTVGLRFLGHVVVAGENWASACVPRRRRAGGDVLDIPVDIP